MSMKSRARAAGRRIAGGALNSALAMAGGGAFFGAHTFIAPKVMSGADPRAMTLRAMATPLAGVVVGHLLTGMPKMGAAGLGVVGGATAIGIEQLQFALAIEKQQASTPASNTGALLQPSDVRAFNTGGVDSYDSYDAGALYQPQIDEAAGLGL